MKVSIITVSYNSEKTIEQTIKSVLNQTYKGMIEYIFVDGASTDKTLNIIKKYVYADSTKDKHSNITMKYISESDSGIYNAMNKGIMLSSGDVIGILNSDDWYSENTIELVVQAYKTNETDVVHGFRLEYEDNGNTHIRKPGGFEKVWDGLPILHPTMFVKKCIYEKYGLYDESYRIAADQEKILDFYFHGVRFYEIPFILTHFRRGGISGTDKRGNLYESNRIATKYIKYFQNPRKIVSIRKNAVEAYYVKEAINENNKIIIDYLLPIIGNKKICIWGCGIWGTIIYNYFVKNGLVISACVDSNVDNIGKCLGNTTIESFDRIVNFDGIILCCVRHIDRNNIQCLVRKDILYIDDIFSICFSWQRAESFFKEQIEQMIELIN